MMLSKPYNDRIKLLEKIHSKLDKTIKYVFQLTDGLITEASYIDKDDGKDIICVASQTGCKLGCKFCFTTDCKDKIIVRGLAYWEIVEQIDYITKDLDLKDKLLLISYMGCGEPLLNLSNIVESMTLIGQMYDSCRFAISTLLPLNRWKGLFSLAEVVQQRGLNIKVHLSLHFVDDKLRKEWMPNALPILPAISALEFYKKLTGNSVEIHYTLIEGVNDTKGDAEKLIELLKGRNIPVKILKYNAKPDMEYSSSKSVIGFTGILEWGDIETEYYDPVGKDVSASCGQLSMDYYLKYNKVED
jgi:23S rRNA (adenine2503-C2)-methyltransferase